MEGLQLTASPEENIMEHPEMEDPVECLQTLTEDYCQENANGWHEARGQPTKHKHF